MEDVLSVMIVVALAMISPCGKVLVQQRSAKKAHGGLWEFPGGKVETGETPQTAIVREIGEELGIHIESPDIAPLSFSNGATGHGAKTLLLLLYTTTRWHGSPAAIEPGTHIRWVCAQELLGLPMPPLDIPLIQAVLPLLAGPVIEGVAKAKRPT